MKGLALGYCTNVHAGADLAITRANLQRHALGVKQRFSPAAPMGVGLWLSAAAARALRGSGELAGFRAFLDESGLVPFTFNGFPHGDFHQAVVKHLVYESTWWEPERLEYTLDLIDIQDALLAAGLEGSISTLPIAWSEPAPTPSQWAQAAAQLRQVAERLSRLEAERGRLIHLCLEPEPGCLLQRYGDVLALFEQHLLPGGDEAKVRRYLRVCHDVCHASVMFEPQAEVLRAYHDAGILVGKVQVSAAVRVQLEGLSQEGRELALNQLAAFDERRYLHQTVVRANGATTFYEDLPQALQAGTRAGEWRVHFHVPIYLEHFGHLQSSQADILECLQAVKQWSEVRHFEVETYAWGVLPESMRQKELAAGIADEMRWFNELVTA